MKVVSEADRDKVLSNVKKLVEGFVNLLPFLDEKEVQEFVELALADAMFNCVIGAPLSRQMKADTGPPISPRTGKSTGNGSGLESAAASGVY